MPRPILGAAATFALLTLVIALATPARAEPTVVAVPSPHGFDAMWDRVRDAVRASPLNLLYRASASRAAAGRGIDIPGNAVFGAYDNVFAVRMLSNSVDAGIHAPLILYLTENADGTTTLRYELPSDIFGAYGIADLTAMGLELDEILARIAADAAGREG